MVALTLAIVAGVLLGVLGLILGGNFLVELLETDSIDAALSDTKTLAAGIFVAIGALVATGIIELAGLVDMFADLLGTSPIALTNMLSIGLGWLGITGRLELGPGIYLAGTLGFLALALFVSEVKA